MMIEQKLARARADYGQKLTERLGALGTLLGELRRGVDHDVDRETIDEAQRLAHRICGSAGTFGFPAVGEAVTIIDQTLLSLLSGKTSPTRATWDRLEEALRQAWEASR